MQRALSFRSALLKAGGCRFTLSLTADYGEYAADFTLSCVCTADGAARFTLQQPQTLEGVCGTAGPGTPELEFDDVRVALPALSGGVAPLRAPYLLCASWTEGFLESAEQTQEGLLVRIRYGYEDEALEIETLLSAEEAAPVRAEIARGGKTVLFAHVSDFSWGSEAA